MISFFIFGLFVFGLVYFQEVIALCFLVFSYKKRIVEDEAMFCVILFVVLDESHIKVNCHEFDDNISS